ALHAEGLAPECLPPGEELAQLEVVHRGGPDPRVDEVRDGGGDQRGPDDEAATVQHGGSPRARWSVRELLHTRKADLTGFSLVVVAVLRSFSETGTERDPPSGRADEGDQLVDIDRAHLRLDARERELQVRPDAEEDAEGRRERAHPLAVESGATEPDAVEAADGVREVDDRERGQVARGAREAAHHHQAPDPAVLMDDAVARDERP